MRRATGPSSGPARWKSSFDAGSWQDQQVVASPLAGRASEKIGSCSDGPARGVAAAPPGSIFVYVFEGTGGQ